MIRVTQPGTMDKIEIHSTSRRSPIRIIFLDIDGVLINNASFKPPLKIEGVRVAAHPDCVAALNRILVETNAMIVVSSSWRLDCNSSTVEMREILSQWGIAGAVIGCTPILQSSFGSVRPRGEEILKWIKEDGERFEIESFVILDDDDDMIHLRDRLVQTEFGRGLTMEHAERAIAMFRQTGELNSSTPSLL
jgi:hypothetical protein